MIDYITVYWAMSGVYLLSTIALILWLRKIPSEYHRLCSLVLLTVVLSGLTTLSNTLGVGMITVGGTESSLPSLVNGLFTATVLLAMGAMIADVSWSLFAAVVGVTVLRRAGFTLSYFTDGMLALAGTLTVVVCYIALVYLFLGPVWKRAQSLSPKQRLLHWKVRNLLLFLNGMFIVFITILITGVLDDVIASLLSQYIYVLLRVGFAAFLFVNIEAIDLSMLGGGPVGQFFRPTGSAGA